MEVCSRHCLPIRIRSYQTKIVHGLLSTATGEKKETETTCFCWCCQGHGTGAAAGDALGLARIFPAFSRAPTASLRRASQPVQQQVLAMALRLVGGGRERGAHAYGCCWR
jgi:hypothetical protein